MAAGIVYRGKVTLNMTKCKGENYFGDHPISRRHFKAIPFFLNLEMIDSTLREAVASRNLLKPTRTPFNGGKTNKKPEN